MAKVVQFPMMGDKEKLFLSDKPYAIGKSRQDGEKDIMELVFSKRNEGGWVFDAGPLLWYNVRYRAVGEEQRVYLLDISQSSLGNDVSEYHSHTFYFEEQKNAAVKKSPIYLDASEVGREEILSCMRKLFAVESCLPSKNDVLGDLGTMVRCDVGQKVDFRIASPHGMLTTVYSRGSSIDDVVEQYMTTLHEVSVDVDSMFSQPDTDSAIEFAIGIINAKMDGAMKTSFRSYENP